MSEVETMAAGRAEVPGGVDRRTLIRRAAVVGAAAWATPMIVDSLASPAGAATGQNANCLYYEFSGFADCTPDPRSASDPGCLPASWDCAGTLGTNAFLNCSASGGRDPFFSLTGTGSCVLVSAVGVLQGTCYTLPHDTGSGPSVTYTGGVLTFSNGFATGGPTWDRVRIVLRCNGATSCC